MLEYVFFVSCIFPFKDSIIGQIQVREDPCPAKMLMVLYLNALLVFSEASPETKVFPSTLHCIQIFGNNLAAC